MTATLLCVDDSKTMRKVLEITFAGENYRTVLAESSEDALGKLRAEKPAVALVDANLGAQSGYDLCQQIKREAPQVGVIILASKQQPFDKARGATVGSDDFIDKPFDTQQLIDKVNAVLRRVGEAARAPAAAAAAPAPMAAAAPLQPMGSAHAAGGGPGLGARPRANTLAYGASAPQPPVNAQAAPAPAVSRVPTFAGTQPASSSLGARPVSAPSPQPPPTAPIAHAPVAQRPAPAPAPAPAPTPQAPAAAPVAAAPAAALAGDGQFADKLSALGLTREQVQGVLSLSREVVEQVVWEVVPVLAETLIKEEIKRLTSEQ